MSLTVTQPVIPLLYRYQQLFKSRGGRGRLLRNVWGLGSSGLGDPLETGGR